MPRKGQALLVGPRTGRHTSQWRLRDGPPGQPAQTQGGREARGQRPASPGQCLAAPPLRALCRISSHLICFPAWENLLSVELKHDQSEAMPPTPGREIRWEQLSEIWAQGKGSQPAGESRSLLHFHVTHWSGIFIENFIQHTTFSSKKAIYRKSWCTLLLQKQTKILEKEEK